MKPYGLKRKDRVICGIIHRECNCGDWESKYPINNKSYKCNRRMKKTERQEVNNYLNTYL